jgi:hypothetical protein
MYSVLGLLPISIFLLIFVTVLFIVSSINPVLAHTEYPFGNITIEPGWVTEPPLVGQLNQIEVTVTRTGSEQEGEDQPVRNAFANLNTDIRSGGLTKSLDFQPSEESAATYISGIIPTSVGSYSLDFRGQIENQNISANVPIEDVEDTTKLEFPQLGTSSTTATSTMSSTSSPVVDSNVVNAISDQVRESISDTSNQLITLNQDINTTKQIAEQALNSTKKTEFTSDRAYVVGMIGIGMGVAGIILAVLLTRKINYTKTIEK